MSSSDQQPKASMGRNASAGSTAAIVIAALAVLLGLLVLKKLSNDDGTTTAPTGTTTTTTLPNNGATGAGGTTTTTAAPTVQPSRNAAKVVVVNAARVSGVGARVTQQLKTVQFSTCSPATGADKLTTSAILYAQGDAKAEATAKYLGNLLRMDISAATTLQLQDSSGFPSGCPVAFVIGTDNANKLTLTAMRAS